jgi:hypothetical protein
MEATHRRRLGFLVAVVAGGTLATAAVGFADVQKINDPENDSPGGRGCEILQVKAGHAKGNRLKHSITVAQPIDRFDSAPVVLLNDQGTGDQGGGIRDFEGVLSGSGDGVRLKYKNGRRTAIYTLSEAKMREEAGLSPRQDRYFWVVQHCQFDGDWAPDSPSGGPKYKGHNL